MEGQHGSGNAGTRGRYSGRHATLPCLGLQALLRWRIEPTRRGVDERFTFFWRADSPFSQWHAGAPFDKFGLRFATAENWMMWRKGELFGASPALLQEILGATPAEAKALGRRVPGFVEAIWQVAARPLVAEGNYAKFTQNPAALRALLDTAGTTLVEASPSDMIWGIGLGSENPLALSRATWRGRNWLGEVLTEIRDTLLAARSET
jgi:ribA/ribD-fused uncharacterized protein